MSKKYYRFFGGLLTAQEHWLNKMSEKGYRLIRAEGLAIMLMARGLLNTALMSLSNSPEAGIPDEGEQETRRTGYGSRKGVF